MRSPIFHLMAYGEPAATRPEMGPGTVFFSPTLNSHRLFVSSCAGILILPGNGSSEKSPDPFKHKGCQRK